MDTALQRRIWPIDCWPDWDRETWTAACEGRGPLGDRNPALAWSFRWRQMIESAHGRYIAWLYRTERLVNQHPADRIHPHLFGEFVTELDREGLAGCVFR